MKETNMEFEDFFDNEENEINEEDYERYNNFRHQKIRRVKSKINSKKNDKKDNKLDNKNDLEEEKLIEKKKNEKNKKNIGQLSKIETIFLTLFKKVSIIRENKMIYQILGIFIILFFLFLIMVIYIKQYLIRTSFSDFKNKNFYSFLESDIIRIQNLLKIQTDTKNNNNMISNLDEELLFMEIYSQELSSHNILKKNIFTNLNNGELESYENELGENFKTTINIENLINEGVTEDTNYNIKNLVPFFYHFTPIIFRNLDFFGLKMINFYFIGNDNKCQNEINNLYFKYPLEGGNIGIDFDALNNKIYDYILDPFINCNSGYEFDDNVLHLIKENNWYYNIIKENEDIEINFRFLKLMKMNQQNERKDYYIAYDKFNLNYDDEEIKINFLFAIRLSKLELKYPFIILDEYNDTLNYDYYSIFNFDQQINQIDLSNIQKSIFEYDYNIDDSSNIFLKIPKFTENMNFFGMETKNKYSMRLLKVDENKLSSDNTIMIKYNEINNIQQNYNINYYYDNYIIYFKLLYFLNQFIIYKQKNPWYLTNISFNSNYGNQGANDKDSKEKDHPCSISNIDEYYNMIKEKMNYDCIYDYCFFHNCEQLNDLYLNINNKHWPNCYCLPLYCKDEKTQKNSKFEKKLKEKLDIGNNEEFDYSYTTNFDYFFSELESPFAEFMVFFNRFSFNFKCELFFGKKNLKENNTFIANVITQNYMTNSRDNIFLFFIYNNAKLVKIINHLHDNSFSIIKKTVYGYLVLFVSLGVLLLIYIYISCNKLINRMNKVKNIRKAIISNANNTNNFKINNSIDNNGNKDETIENNNNDINSINNLSEKEKKNIDNNSLINNNENDNLINNQENKDNKIKNNKTNNEDKDELDELMDLINDNLPTFKIEFNLNEELNDNLNNIKKQYNEIIQVNKYKNKLLLKEDKEEIIFDNHDDSSISSSNNSINIKKNTKIDDLSVNIFCELLSLSNHKFDFSNIKTNFYYKENNDNSLYNLNQFIGSLNEVNIINNNENVEITNIDKLQNALEHYSNNIHSYWKNYYDVQKAKDEI